MKNGNSGLKKFLSNKNTVTVLGVVAAVVVLYIAYNMRVSSATNPIDIPYATTTISPGVEITEDMVAIAQTPRAALKGEIITNIGDVIGKYSNDDSIIPEGSLFYKRSVVEKEQLRANIILDYKDGYVLYNLPVNTSSTYGNSMFPGNYMDIYLKASAVIDPNNPASVGAGEKILVAKLIENVKILAVQDANGRPVFANVDETKTPAMIIFAVPEDLHILIRKATYLNNYDTEIIPIPTNESLKDEPGDVKLSTKQLEDFINSVTTVIE